MHWFKDSIVDILVTVAVLTAVLAEIPILNGIIVGYTAILLLAKAIILIGDDSLNLLNKTETKAPDWLPHLLYGVNTIALLYAGWWYTGCAWAVIWLLSYLAQQELNRRKGKVPG